MSLHQDWSGGEDLDLIDKKIKKHKTYIYILICLSVVLITGIVIKVI